MKLWLTLKNKRTIARAIWLIMLSPCVSAETDTATIANATGPSASTDALRSAKSVSCNLAAPPYPSTQRRLGISGNVIVKAVLDTTGRFDLVTIDKSSGNVALDEAARNAVTTSVCRPYVENGVAIRVAMRIPFRFDLAPADGAPAAGAPLATRAGAASPNDPLDATRLRQSGIEPDSAKAASLRRWAERIRQDTSISRLLGYDPQRALFLALDPRLRAAYFANGVSKLTRADRSTLLELTSRTPPDCAQVNMAPLAMSADLALSRMSNADFDAYLNIMFEIFRVTASPTERASVTEDQYVRASEAVARTRQSLASKEAEGARRLAVGAADPGTAGPDAICRSARREIRALLATPQPFRDWALLEVRTDGKGTQASGLRGASGGTTDNFPNRVQRRVRPNIKWTGPSEGIETTIKVHCAPTGTILSATIVRSSGDEAFDAAALQAVERSDPMPLDVNGRTPPWFQLTIRPY